MEVAGRTAHSAAVHGDALGRSLPGRVHAKIGS